MASATPSVVRRTSYQSVDVGLRVERALGRAVESMAGGVAPPTLAEAMCYAIMSGGARLRPQLVVVAAIASGDRQPELTDAAAAAIELIHSASLVHDDLPCFDDAEQRRGRPTVHAVYGEPLAILVGDGLVVQAFDVLAGAAFESRAVEGAAWMVRALAEAAGARKGLVAGQAWEVESSVPLALYHRAKTASLFTAAARMGAFAGGGDVERWGAFGDLVGRAYQAADDLADAVGDPATLGKPVARDGTLGRPSLVRSKGVQGARATLRAMMSEAVDVLGQEADDPLVQAWLGALTSRMWACAGPATP